MAQRCLELLGHGAARMDAGDYLSGGDRTQSPKTRPKRQDRVWQVEPAERTLTVYGDPWSLQ